MAQAKARPFIPMAIEPTVQRMSPRQRERWAYFCVLLLGSAALAWGLYVYWWRPRQIEPPTGGASMASPALWPAVEQFPLAISPGMRPGPVASAG